MSTATARESRFNAGYYSKWYGEDITTRQYIADKAARFVVAYVEHMDSSIGTALDLGCGLGLWREALAKYAKRVRYTGVEFSSHLCRKLGWERGDVRTYSPGRTFDLVICQAVLQYLPDDECELAIENLARRVQADLSKLRLLQEYLPPSLPLQARRHSDHESRRVQAADCRAAGCRPENTRDE